MKKVLKIFLYVVLVILVIFVVLCLFYLFFIGCKWLFGVILKYLGGLLFFQKINISGVFLEMIAFSVTAFGACLIIAIFCGLIYLLLFRNYPDIN